MSRAQFDEDSVLSADEIDRDLEELRDELYDPEGSPELDELGIRSIELGESQGKVGAKVRTNRLYDVLTNSVEEYLTDNMEAFLGEDQDLEMAKPQRVQGVNYLFVKD